MQETATDRNFVQLESFGHRFKKYISTTYLKKQKKAIHGNSYFQQKNTKKLPIE